MTFYKTGWLYGVAGLLFLGLHIQTEAKKNITTFIPRSTGTRTDRELSGWQRQLFRAYNENYATIASAIEYTRSFDMCAIAQKLFSTNRLTFAGSQNQNRTDNDIVADYFGLPTDFHGTVAIEPRIENVVIDLNFYFGLDALCYGLYFRIHAPITHTRWTLGLDTCLPCDDTFRGCTQFPQCYMLTERPGATTPDCPVPQQSDRVLPDCPVNPTLTPPQQFRNGNCTTQSIREALSGNFTFGDLTEPWKFGRFDFCSRSKTGLADIDAILGFNFLHNDYAHFSLFGLAVIPTGNRPKAKFIFEPLIGGGRHWQVGGGLSAHVSWNPDREGCTSNGGIYVEGTFTNVFKTHQKRSFDFKENGLLSRYILLKEFDTEDMYSEKMINAINFATRNCEVSVGLQVDASAKLFFVLSNWEFDVGYNGFFREREKICIRTDCPCDIDSRRFGIKGLEGVCCISYPVTNGNVQPNPTVTPLNTTQSNATMFKANLPKTAPVPQDPEAVCLSWNSAQIAKETPVADLIDEGFILADTAAQPQFVTCDDLDPESAAQGRMVTHKIFGHMGYTFENSCYTPFIGIGAMGEFDGHCDNALAGWGIWLKGGASF